MKFLIVELILLMAGCTPKTEQNEPELRRTAVNTDETERLAVPVEVTVGEASTPLLDDSEPRVNNINIACGEINGVAIYPGGTFSFNETVGKRSSAKGYEDAPVLINGHKEQGCGGGVCQVSTTIYMAALQAGLQIDERHPHAHGVGYAPEDMDATVVFGEKDFRFTNNTNDVLTLSVWTDGKAVFSKITKKSLTNNR